MSYQDRMRHHHGVYLRFQLQDTKEHVRDFRSTYFDEDRHRSLLFIITHVKHSKIRNQQPSNTKVLVQILYRFRFFRYEHFFF